MKTIIEMAREADIEEAFSLKHDQYLVRFKDDSLERFAALVRADERERPWVGLTDEERKTIADATIRIHGQEWAYATAIEAKLKEKNT